MRSLSRLAMIFSTCAVLAVGARAQGTLKGESLERTDFSADLRGITPHQVVSVSDTASVSVYDGLRGIRQELNDGSVYYVNYKQRFFSKGGFTTEKGSGKRVWWQSTREIADVTDAKDLAKIKELRSFLPPRMVPCPQF